MHTQSHALSLLLLDFSKPFLYVTHYFNKATTECFCLCKTHGHLLLICSRPWRDCRVSQKKCGLSSQGSIPLYLLQVPNMRKTTCAFSFPPWEAAPGDNTIPKYRVGLCLRAAELFMRTRTPATLLVPETLTWVLGNSSSTHLSCPNSAVTKVKTWLTWQEN